MSPSNTSQLLTDERIQQIAETIIDRAWLLRSGTEAFMSWGQGFREDADGRHTIPHLIGAVLPFARAVEAEVRSLRSQGEPVAFIPAYELDRLMSGHDGRVRSTKFGPSQLDGDVALYASPPSQPIASRDTHAFQNFHRSLCARFGYVHDPVDWRRDQVSLEEHIAALCQPIASDVDAAPEPKREPITNPHNWFPALHAIVEVWKSQGDYKADALDKMIASASRDIDESRELYAKASVAAPDVLSRQSPVEADTLSSEATKGPWRVGADLQAIHPNYRDDKGNDTPDNYHRNGFAKVIVKGKNPDDLRLIVAAVNAYRAASPSDTSQGALVESSFGFSFAGDEQQHTLRFFYYPEDTALWNRMLKTDRFRGVQSDTSQGVSEAAIRTVIHQLRTYNPAADAYKGKYIHRVWADELETALRSEPGEKS